MPIPCSSCGGNGGLFAPCETCAATGCAPCANCGAPSDRMRGDDPVCSDLCGDLCAEVAESLTCQLCDLGELRQLRSRDGTLYFVCPRCLDSTRVPVPALPCAF